MDKLLTIQETADILNVSTKTLRRWDDSPEGKLKSIRTEGGHRRYKSSDIQEILGEEIDSPNEDGVAVYCRVSSHEQKTKGDLERQKGRILEHCVNKKYQVVKIFEEVGSGMNDKRSKLKQMMKLAERGKISKVIIEHKDRLTRFNKEIYFAFFKTNEVEVEWMNETLTKSDESEMVEDMISLISSYSSKIYGKRSANRRKKNKESKK